ncbi:MAG: riboflavin biosynthesis protein RibF [Planctomycetes bacterium]|nr:riboflavin biosynthesis protein RibF [Planctomycetota bacterium]
MELIRDCDSLHKQYAGAALTVGNFDGVHLGHQRILGEVVRAARATTTSAVAFTFEPHPAAILHPDKAPPRLLGFQQKLDLFESLGIDVVVCPEDGREILQLDAETFVRRIMVDGVGAAVIVEGPGFRFGHRQRGDEAMLRRMGPEHGFAVQVVDAMLFGDAPVSSTRIREAVAAGRVGDALKMLGRPFEFDGVVAHGHGRGSGLGYPTINVAGGDFLVPGDGVYVGWATLPAGTFAAAISVGRAPTFHDVERSVVEAYLLDFQGQAYDQEVRLQFVARLREQRAFRDGRALGNQIADDCRAVRALLGRSP